MYAFSYVRKKELVKRRTLIISNQEMTDILKIFKSLEESDLLKKCVRERITK